MICVDASVAAKWLFVEEYSEQAIGLLTSAARTGERIVAPALLQAEVTNVIRRRMVRFGLPLDEARNLLDRFDSLPVTIMSPSNLSGLALTLASEHNLPAVYDAHYLALAQLLRGDLWTSDLRLVNSLGGKLPFIKWIGNYQPPA